VGRAISRHSCKPFVAPVRLHVTEENLLDEMAVRAFLANDYRRVVAAVTLVCADAANAEDAVQEALKRAWERGRSGEVIDRPTAWVAVVAMNLARSGLRRRLAERKAMDRLSTPLGSDPPSADTIDVVRAIRTLPKRQRQAIVLHYFVEMTIPEIAMALGISEGTVKNALFRARRSLAKIIDNEVTA
jgi:RNA polymerase sigma-70 factor, ECF subfamily